MNRPRSDTRVGYGFENRPGRGPLALLVGFGWVVPFIGAAVLASTDPVVLDVRSRSSFDREQMQIPGSVRVFPDQVTDWAAGQSKISSRRANST